MVICRSPAIVAGSAWRAADGVGRRRTVAAGTGPVHSWCMPSRPRCSIALAAATGRGPAGRPTPPRPVAAVDLQQYAGTYYEIARFPNGSRSSARGDVTATYAIRPDGRIDVDQPLPEGRRQRSTRRAASPSGPARTTSNAQAQGPLRAGAGCRSCRGAGATTGCSAWGRSTATPWSATRARNYLWILSRLPRMPDLAYRQALEIATQQRLRRQPAGEDAAGTAVDGQTSDCQRVDVKPIK